MKPMTHQNVQALLQAAADKTLMPEEQMALDAHLAGCKNCRSYAWDLVELQDGLRRVMRQQWNKHQASLSIQTIKIRSKKVLLQNKITGTIGRFAVIPLLAFAFVMAVKMAVPQQVTLNTVTSLTPELSYRTPTPPSRLTATKLNTQVCEKVTYLVQENDTLDGIAARYDVQKEAIMTYNELASDSLAANTKLVIPLCKHTPTGTTTVPALTITTSPQNGPLSPSPTG